MGVKRRRLGTAGALHRISRDGPFQGSRVDKRRPLRAVSRVVAGFQTRAPTWHARAAVRCRGYVRGRGIGTSRARVPRRSSRPARLIGVQRGSRRCLDSPGLVSSDEMSAHARIGRMGVCGSVKVFNAFDPFIWYITTRTEKPVIQRHFRLSSCLVAINITSFCKLRTQALR